jgi:hypothetical protein
MNTTTLNMTTLDGGNVIIKKGQGGGSTPPSGGGNLSPDAIVYEPNGWYWKWVEGVPSDFKRAAQTLLVLTIDFGARYYDGLIKDTTASWPPIHAQDILVLGMNLRTMQNSTDNKGLCVFAVVESKYCSVKIDDTTTLTGNSMYELVNQLMPMTEAEFDNFMQANMGLMRITKEEYEALLTE